MLGYFLNYSRKVSRQNIVCTNYPLLYYVLSDSEGKRYENNGTEKNCTSFLLSDAGKPSIFQNKPYHFPPSKNANTNAARYNGFPVFTSIFARFESSLVILLTYGFTSPGFWILANDKTHKTHKLLIKYSLTFTTCSIWPTQEPIIVINFVYYQNSRQI